jgi:hypothetical protein
LPIAGAGYRKLLLLLPLLLLLLLLLLLRLRRLGALWEGRGGREAVLTLSLHVMLSA